MFVLNNENTKFPVKIWLEDQTKLEANCLEQACNLSRLPFLSPLISVWSIYERSRRETAL